MAGEADLEVTARDQTGLPVSLVRTISGTEGVRRAVPLMRIRSRLATGSSSERALVLGITPEFPSVFGSEAADVLTIRGGFGPNGDGLLITDHLRRAMGAGIGDDVDVETPNGSSKTRLTGTLSGDLVSTLNGGRLGVMLLPAAQKTFERQGRVDSVFVFAQEGARSDRLEEVLSDEIGGAALVDTPEQLSSALEREFATLTGLTSLAGTAAIFVAIFVVYTAMSTSFLERRRQFATALAVGASDRTLMLAFLFEAAAIGAISSLVGIAAGVGLAGFLKETAVEAYRWLPATVTGPIEVTGRDVALGVISGLAVSLAAGFVPARNILSVTPLESLRRQAPWAVGEGGRVTRNLLIAAIVGGVCALAAVAGLVVYAVVATEFWIANVSLLLLLSAVTLFLPVVVPFTLRALKPLLTRLFGALGRLAADGLLRNPRRTAVATGALVITVGAALGIGGAMGSFHSRTVEVASNWFGAPLFVNSSSCVGFACDQPLSGALRSELADVEGVGHVFPWDYAFVTTGTKSLGIYAVPVAAAGRQGATTRLSSTGEEPNLLLTALSEGDVAVSRYTASRRNLGVGDSIRIPTPQGYRTFGVGALFDDLISFDSMYLEYSTYRNLWKDDHPTRYAILPEEDASVHSVNQNVSAMIDDRGVPAEVVTKDELIDETLGLSEGLFSLARGIQLAALIVAVMAVATTMFAGVAERRWEFGLQQMIGMKPLQLGRLVLLEGGVIGLIGGVGAIVSGTLFGLLMLRAMELQFVWRIPFELPVGLIVWMLLIACALALAAAMYPRHVAVHGSIIESLRYE